MADFSTELITAVMTKFTTSTPTIYTNLGGRMYFYELPQKTTSSGIQITTQYPCAVFRPIGQKPEWWMYSGGTPHAGEDLLMDFTIYTRDATVGNLLTYVSNLKTLYDWCSITMTSYTLMSMQRISISAPMKIDDVWQQTVTYRIRIDTK